MRADVAQTNTLRQMHQTNLSSLTQIKHEENIRLYYAVRRQGREPLSPVSKSCSFITHQSTLTSFLWHVQIRLLPVCLPNYSLHIFLFFLGPSIQHTLTVSWLMFVKDDMEKSFVFHGKTSLCCISSHLWTYSSCKHHRLGYWWTLVWGGALTLYRHVPTAHNVSLFLMLTQ